jgi:hypothetical protein
MSLKLEIELVPATTWYTNLRKVLPPEEWDRIRKKAYREQGYRCGICGAQERLSCHEIWNYDDDKHVQTLVGFVALCNMCHHVKHIGLAGILASEGKLDYSKVIKHFMKVNNCDYSTFETHRIDAFRKWEERSQYQWKVDLGMYNVYIDI